MTQEEAQAAAEAEGRKTYAVNGSVRQGLLDLLASLQSTDDGRVCIGPGVQAIAIGILQLGLGNSPELPQPEPPKAQELEE